MNKILELAKKIRCLVCDVDGVLTDGLLYMDNFGNELKGFHVHDGMGLKLLMAAGIEVAVITTSRNAVIDHRMGQLGITHYFKGQVDKRQAYADLKQKLGFEDEVIAYIGDDLPDLPIIKQVGLAVTVPDGTHLLKELAHWVTKAPGGRGAVREVCDIILSAQTKFDDALLAYYGS